MVYKPGPWSIGLTYAQANAEGVRTTQGEDVVRRWMLGATYAIGPGVTAMANVLHHRYNDEANVQSNENKGVAVIGGIQLAF